MKLSVVIPAYNTNRSLAKVLTQLIPQIQHVRGEIVVVDDGSRVPVFFASSLVRVIRQQHSGSANARNHGAKEATGDVILFLGADIIPLPQLVALHSAVHRQYPDPRVGCLGHVTWDPALPPTPWMVFLEHGGPQNAYERIAGKTWVDPESYLYGANISIKSSLFKASGGFDELLFSSYGWEDLELGMRLSRQHNFRLLYEPAARGLHHHNVSVDDSLFRMESIGAGARVLLNRYPDIPIVRKRHERWAAPLRRILFPPILQYILTGIMRRTASQYILPRFYTRVLSFAFFRGFYKT